MTNEDLTPMPFDYTDKKLLNLLQTGFPLALRPFALLGEQLGISEENIFDRISRFKQKGIVRLLAAVFDSTKIGYISTLAAVSVPDSRLDEAAAIINRHSGVGHNYARRHKYNLWFTMTLPVEKNLKEEAFSLAAQAGSEKTLFLPALRRFKINVQFDMLEDLTHSPVGSDKFVPGLLVSPVAEGRLRPAEGGMGGEPRDGSQRGAGRTSKPGTNLSPRPLSHLDKKIIRELCRDLPLEKEPFKKMAASLDISVKELLDKAKSYQRSGIMRRYEASLDHINAGFKANAMTCWAMAPETIEQAGRIIAGHDKVSHCYQRETASDWPYGLYAMIHSRAAEDCEAVAKELGRAIGNPNHVSLYSFKEYKKKRVAYFTDEER